jgi:hypothetical protein
MPIAHLLRPYQEQAALRIAGIKAQLLADQPGLGKTFTSLGALEIAGVLVPGAVILIMAPGTVCDSAWLPTIQAHMPEVNVIDGYSGTRRQRSSRIEKLVTGDKPNIIVTNHESLGVSPSNKAAVPALHHIPEYAAILVDESHAVLPMDYDFEAQATQFWRGLFRINRKVRKGGVRIAISGTPDRGKLQHRFGTWRFLMPEVMAAENVKYQEWLAANFYLYTITVQVKSKWSEGTFPKEIQRIGQMRSPKAWLAVDKAMVIRRTKLEVADDLPEKQYVDIDLELPAEQDRAYEAFLREFMADNEDGSRQAATLFALRAQQFATATWTMINDVLVPLFGGPSGKLDWILHWLDGRGYRKHSENYNPTGGKVVISSMSVRVLNWLHNEFDARHIESAVLTGDSSLLERKRTQARFQDPTDTLRVVLLSAKLGVGIDLDAADDLIMIDIPRDPDVQEQVEDRVHRVSRNHQVTIWRLRGRGTIDMIITAKNDAVFQKTRALLDGSRDIQFQRRVLARLTPNKKEAS